MKALETDQSVKKKMNDQKDSIDFLQKSRPEIESLIPKEGETITENPTLNKINAELLKLNNKRRERSELITKLQNYPNSSEVTKDLLKVTKNELTIEDMIEQHLEKCNTISTSISEINEKNEKYLKGRISI
jgi:DNA repair ATPase RecN